MFCGFLLLRKRTILGIRVIGHDNSCRRFYDVGTEYMFDKTVHLKFGML